MDLGVNIRNTCKIKKTFLPRKRLEIFAPDSLVEIIFETIMQADYSGQHGDG
jgi:nitrogen regulatory protein PII